MRKQTWSLQAYKCVESKRSNSSYLTLARKVPSLLQRSGVIQTLVFLLSRKDGGVELFDDLIHTYFPSSEGDTEAFLQTIQNSNLGEYISISRDMMDIAIWFRRYSQIDFQRLEDKGE